jgi:sphingolipid delta-4 desaturase
MNFGIKGKSSDEPLSLAPPTAARHSSDVTDRDDEPSGARRKPTAAEGAAWHVARHRAILAEHPEIRALFGVEPASGAWVVGLAVGQVALALWAGRHSGWVLAAVAATAGAVVAHALGVLIHEASHNLVFRGSWKNKTIAIVANVPLGAPAAIEFRHQHLLHHRYLGETAEPAGRDTQAPTRKEVDVVGYSSVWKLLSFTFGRFFYKARTADAAPKDGWFWANVAACVAFDAIFVLSAGWKPFVFLVASSLLAFGPHVVGARRVAEHLTVRRGQPTNSYYGPLNRVSFDVGYHVEHHDFPAVPWSRMRRLREAAAARYEGLAAVRSWSALMARYFFDGRFTVGHYTGVRSEYLEEVFGLEPTLERDPDLQPAAHGRMR